MGPCSRPSSTSHSPRSASSPPRSSAPSTPVDCCDIAELLEWVQRAGSWQTGFVTPDRPRRPRARPRFRAVDLEITVCVKPGFLPSDVRDRVLLRLRGDATTQGFFSVDSFTFGMPLHRLTLEAAIGSVPGVLGVLSIRIAARGFHLPRNLEPVYRVPDNQILRLANDPRTPERGSIKVYTEGGV